MQNKLHEIIFSSTTIRASAGVYKVRDNVRLITGQVNREMKKKRGKTTSRSLLVKKIYQAKNVITPRRLPVSLTKDFLLLISKRTLVQCKKSSYTQKKISQSLLN